MSMANPSEIGARPLRSDYDLEAATTNNREFQWQGPIEECSTDHIIQWMENRLTEIDAGSLQKKRILRVAIEILQNLHHHAKSPKADVSFEIVSDHASHWWIRSENPVSRQQENYIKETLKALSDSDPNQLRAIQRNKIAYEARSEHGGAGVGLNEMIRKSLGQVYVEFTNVNSSQRHVIFLTKLELT
ncbi:MAG: hypothetical protein CL834_07510 [Crocinitomicaceae bacterium]|nr:hypothetical protein [Crocinitomicaceae bacterium]